MTSGLRGRILSIASIAMICTLMLSMGVIGWVFGKAHTEAMSSRAVAVTDALSHQFESLLALGLAAGDIIGFDQQCREAIERQESLGYALVATPDGTILFHSDPARIGQSIPDSALSDSLALPGQRVLPFVDIDGMASYAAVRPAMGPGSTYVASVIVGFSKAGVDRELAELYIGAALTGVIVTIFGLLALLWGLSRQVTRPLTRLANDVDRIRLNDEKGVRLASPEKHDELGVMVHGFNRLLERIDEREAELVEAREAALAGSRAKSEFMSVVSHELRTPLNGMIGMSTLMGRTELNPKQTHYLEVIQMTGNTLLRIVNDVLDFVQLEAGTLTVETMPLVPANCVRETVNALAGTAEEKGLKLRGEVAAELEEAFIGDEGRLKQALSKLVENAIKFTEQGYVCVDARQLDDGSLCFTVEDTGPGISEDEGKRIFEPFTQVDASHTRKHGGTGLGLAIVQRLVQIQDGEVSVSRNGEKGTRFAFTLPLTRPDTRPALKGSTTGSS